MYETLTINVCSHFFTKRLVTLNLSNSMTTVNQFTLSLSQIKLRCVAIVVIVLWFVVCGEWFFVYVFVKWLINSKNFKNFTVFIVFVRLFDRLLINRKHTMDISRVPNEKKLHLCKIYFYGKIDSKYLFYIFLNVYASDLRMISWLVPVAFRLGHQRILVFQRSLLQTRLRRTEIN